jgi:serine/threonine protein kinase
MGIWGACMREVVTENPKEGRAIFVGLFATILLKVTDGLMFLHSKNMVHRDVKPDNIIVKQDQPIIIDFGLFYIVNAGLALDFSGTAEYISPETYRNTSLFFDAVGDDKAKKKEVALVSLVSSDFYALGVTIYKIINDDDPYGRYDFGEIKRKAKGVNELMRQEADYVERVVKRKPNALALKEFQALVDGLLAPEAKRWTPKKIVGTLREVLLNIS